MSFWDDLYNSVISGGGALFQFPSDLSMYPGYIRFTPYNKDDIQVGNQIQLPLPISGLQFADGMSYENAELGTLGLMLEKAVQTDGLESVMNRYTAEQAGEGSPSGFKQLAADVAVKMGGNQTRSLAKATPNPNTTMLFKQPNLRQFSFQFKLIPTRKDEVQKIESIIKEFRTHMYPQFDGDEAGDNLFYRFPQRFDIKIYLGNGTTIQDVRVKPYIEKCYLTAMNTTFNSSTNAVMSQNGQNLSFAETDLSLTFMETKALHSNKIRFENY